MTGEAEQIKAILREYWPEAGGQSALAEFDRAQDAAVERLLALKGEQ